MKKAVYDIKKQTINLPEVDGKKDDYSLLETKEALTERCFDFRSNKREMYIDSTNMETTAGSVNGKIVNGF